MANITDNRHIKGRHFIATRRTDRTPRKYDTTRRLTSIIKESPHKDETLLHSYYARSFMGDHRAQTAQTSIRRKQMKLSNLGDSSHNPRFSAFEITDMQDQCFIGPPT
jgi:hypothetical protein